MTKPTLMISRVGNSVVLEYLHDHIGRLNGVNGLITWIKREYPERGYVVKTVDGGETAKTVLQHPEFYEKYGIYAVWEGVKEDIVAFWKDSVDVVAGKTQ